MGAAAYAYKPQFASAIGRRETRTRRKRRQKAKVMILTRKFVYCAMPLAFILLYLGLMATLTVQTYHLDTEQKTHATLVERNNALRSRVAQLESVDRLQAVAKQLHMSEPRKVAFISTPVEAQTAPPRLALFVRILGVTRWLGVR